MKQEISMFPNAFIYDTSIFFFILSVITYNINVIVSYLKCFNTFITINYHTKLSTKQTKLTLNMMQHVSGFKKASL